MERCLDLIHKVLVAEKITEELRHELTEFRIEVELQMKVSGGV